MSLRLRPTHPSPEFAWLTYSPREHVFVLNVLSATVQMAPTIRCRGFVILRDTELEVPGFPGSTNETNV